MRRRVQVTVGTLIALLSLATGCASGLQRVQAEKPVAAEGFVSEEAVLQVGRDYDNKVSWNAVFEPDLIGRDGQPVWKLEATYPPAMTRVIIFADARTAEVLEIHEAPAGTPMTGNR
ncbi:MAG TPA: hypothetical protein VD973_22555 [Symbiobacteriaceae bacterium]|nr:hypothetical protein [Symbiobacteriaceae bacterium]